MRIEKGRGSGIKPIENIQLQNERLIGSGHFGDAFSVDGIISDGKKSHTKRLVLKRYREQSHTPGSAKRNALQAMSNYEKAKTAGLRVFPTFRLMEDEESILMTSGHSPEWVCLGSNRGSDSVRNFEQFHDEYLDDSADIQELIQNIFDQAQLAGEHGISLDADSIFFLVNTQPNHTIDFVIGDYDMLFDPGVEEQLQYNLAYIRVALETFIGKNFRDESGALSQSVAIEFTRRGGDKSFLMGLITDSLKKDR